MQRWIGAFVWCALSLFVGVAVAQPEPTTTPERSASVFAATVEGQAFPDGLIDRLTQRLTAERYRLLPVTGYASSEQDAQARQADSRALGNQALRELGQVHAKELLARYGERIDRALSFAAETRAREARPVLWNLCVLKVQLLWMSGETRADIDAMIGTCRRSFVDMAQFSAAWLPEVVEAFKQHAAVHPGVPLSVQTSPASCDVFLYGARVGTSPLRTEVPAGTQRVQVRCGDRDSRVHVVEVDTPRALSIWLDGDTALREQGSASALLVYPSGAAQAHAVDHARALMQEVGADVLVMASALGADVRLELLHPDGTHVRSVMVAPGASPAAEQAAFSTLLGLTVAPALSASPAREPAWRRHWADFALGGALLAGGVAVSVTPWLAVARNGMCYDDACTRLYDGDGVKVALGIGAGAILAAAGTAVLWRAPFGRRFNVGAGASTLRVGGVF